MHYDPATTIIEKCGGPDAVAQITGRNYTQVCRWRYSKKKGGTGGTIPGPCARAILQHATTHGLEISAADFLEVPQLRDRKGTHARRLRNTDTAPLTAVKRTRTPGTSRKEALSTEFGRRR